MSEPWARGSTHATYAPPAPSGAVANVYWRPVPRHSRLGSGVHAACTSPDAVTRSAYTSTVADVRKSEHVTLTPACCGSATADVFAKTTRMPASEMIAARRR